MPQDFSNLVEVYQNSVANYADHDLFGVKEHGEYQWITYREFGERVDACRAALAKRGVEPGTTVAIIADNRVEWAVCAYATYGLGARYCPMYESQALKDRKYILDDSEARFLFTADREIREEIEGIQADGELQDIKHIVHFDGGGEGDFEALLGEGQSRDVDVVEPDPDDVCALIYTSGTTGNPKGVLLTHRNLTSNINAIHDIDIIEPDDVSLAFLPWAHSFGQTAELHGLFSIGASMGLVEDISTIIENLGEVRPTLLFSVPRVFNKIYDGVNRKIHKESAFKRKLFQWSMNNANHIRDRKKKGKGPGLFRSMLDSIYDSLIFSTVRERFGGRLRYAVSGGAKLNEEVALFLDNLHITVLEGYGLTETSPLVSVNLPEARKIGSVGRPIPGVDVTLEPAPGHSDKANEGEVCVNGPNVMKGYFKLPDKTREVLEEDGTFHTGDLGRFDEDGFLYIIGRVKEQYKLENGKYVVPGPMEEAIKLSSYVDQVMVDGANRPFNIAIVNVDPEGLDEWAEDNEISLDDYAKDERVQSMLREELEERMAEFKKYERPRKYVFVNDEWSAENGILTPTLKLKRRIILDMYSDEIKALYKGT
jgi:long-chain acyl-CoA synthetase